MVRVDFICEGETEKIIIESRFFKKWLASLQIDRLNRVIDAGGNGNLLPHNLSKYTEILTKLGAEKIVIITDRDNHPCITSVRERIQPPESHVLIVAVQQFESWFLADTEAISTLLADPNYVCNEPEAIETPFEHIRKLLLAKKTRGIGREHGKKILANRMLNHHHFSIARAAQHPNCPSAKYFMDKLTFMANS